MSQPVTDYASVNLSEAFANALQSTQTVCPTSTWSQNNFVQTLLGSLREGVLITNANGVIQAWNPALEKLMGIASEQMLGNQFSPALLGLKNSEGEEVTVDGCPVLRSLAGAETQTGAYYVVGRSGREARVDISCSPVLSQRDTIEGVVVCLHDASVQNSLERQLKDLYQVSMIDPLTQVFNRSEFERVLEQYVRAKNSIDDFRCCLIVCDIDFFKAINDNFNHHIGDLTLVEFAGVLKKFTRSHDLVARFGGEEFLILCGNCDLESGMQRAEEIRVTLTKTAMSMLNGKCITASFGVAELALDEKPKELFVRADAALLNAKETGRNKVVCASDVNAWGSTGGRAEAPQESASGLTWRKTKKKFLISEEFITATPIPVLIEQLRGYILESSANIEKVESDYASIQVEAHDPRKKGAKKLYQVEFEFQSSSVPGEAGRKPRQKTFIRIVISEGKSRWFGGSSNDLAPPLLRDIRRYLMIHDDASRLKIDPAVTRSTRDH